MQITVNGKPHELVSVMTVDILLESLSLSGKRIAVEYNGEILPKSTYAETVLNDGDCLEVVVAVGGG